MQIFRARERLESEYPDDVRIAAEEQWNRNVKAQEDAAAAAAKQKADETPKKD